MSTLLDRARIPRLDYVSIKRAWDSVTVRVCAGGRGAGGGALCASAYAAAPPQPADSRLCARRLRSDSAHSAPCIAPGASFRGSG